MYVTTYILRATNDDDVRQWNKLLRAREYDESTGKNQLVIKSVDIINDHTLLITARSNKNPDHFIDVKQNVICGIFTTSHARLKIYRMLEELEQKQIDVLYMDTDSVIFVRNIHSMFPPPQLGLQLGEWTNEVNDIAPDQYSDTQYIQTFGCNGKKSYILVFPDGKYKIAMKGLRFRQRQNDELITKQQIFNVILHDNINIKFDFKQIVRSKHSPYSLTNFKTHKVLRSTFENARKALDPVYQDSKVLHYISSRCYDNTDDLKVDRTHEIQKRVETKKKKRPRSVLKLRPILYWGDH